MSIEFYCTQCDAFLRAPDSKQSLAISCPHCLARVWVPQNSELERLEDFDDAWQTDEENDQFAAAALQAATNQFQSLANNSPDLKQCVRCGKHTEFAESWCGNCGKRFPSPDYLGPNEVDLGRILSETWRVFSKNWKPCFAVTLLDTFLTFAGIIIAFFIGGFSAALVAKNPGSSILAFLVVAGLGLSVLLSMFAVGHLRFYLELCRNQSPDLRSSLNFQGPIGAILVGGIVYWSLFLLILPAIFLWPFGRVVLDQKRSAVSAICRTLELSGKHVGVCMALFVIKIGALLASGMIPVAGTLIVTPYLAILNTVAYLHFTGELE